MTQRLFALCVVFLFLGSTVAIAQSDQPSMTNSDVIRMIQEGLSEDAIISAIQAATTNFDTRSNGTLFFPCIGLGVFYQTKSSMR